MSNIKHWYSSTKEEQWVDSTLKKEFKTEKEVHLSIGDQSYQTVGHFGGCFNELGFQALSYLSKKEQEQYFFDMFHPDGEQKFTMCRLPIGANDYALEWYSLNEHDNDYNMEHFSIERDRKYLIPYIKKALEMNPDLKLFASPWSPPTWMKKPKAYNFGTMRWEKKVLEAYALYFVKFIQAYKKEGIKIDQIHVQNEVIADQKFPSCVWTGEQLREFIAKYLGPTFEKYGLETEIWLGTINAPEPWEELVDKTTSDYDAYANIVLSDPEALQYINGVGYQWAGKYAIQRTTMSYPELQYTQTENECGDGHNTWDYAKYVFNLYLHYFINGVNNYTYWNMVLEPKGMSTWGWEQNSMVTVDPKSKKRINNPEYYVMKHFSHFVRPGMKRIDLEGQWAGNSLAFQKENGEKVVIFSNPFKEPITLNVSVGETKHVFTLPKESFHTIVLN